jgi:hypothetical protein
MRIQVGEPNQLDALLSHLRKSGCIAFRADERTIEAHIPDARDERAERLELGVYVASWLAYNPDAEATFTS